MTTIRINASPSTFPLPELLACGLWAALSPAARAVLGVIWDHYRQYPDACHPSRTTIAAAAGVSAPTVTRAVRELEDTGLLRVIPATGPGANTYRIDWSAVRVPDRRSKASAKGATPYERPGGDGTVTLVHSAKDGKRVHRDRRGHGYRLPDGCYVRSAGETAIHAFLVDWRVPHWANVSYRGLGVKGLSHLSTADFVVGPRLLIERWGLPRIQSQAAKYNRKRREKELAIERAGWKLIGLEANENVLEEEHINIILDVWANATVEDAQKLKEQLDRAHAWRTDLSSCQLLENHIEDALARRLGEKPPRDYSGTTRMVSHAGRPETCETVPPVIVLETGAGRTTTARVVGGHPQGDEIREQIQQLLNLEDELSADPEAACDDDAVQAHTRLKAQLKTFINDDKAVDELLDEARSSRRATSFLLD